MIIYVLAGFFTFEIEFDHFNFDVCNTECTASFSLDFNRLLVTLHHLCATAFIVWCPDLRLIHQTPQNENRNIMEYCSIHQEKYTSFYIRAIPTPNGMSSKWKRCCYFNLVIRSRHQLIAMIFTLN